MNKIRKFITEKATEIIILFGIVLFASVCFLGGMMHGVDTATEKFNKNFKEATYFSVDPTQMDAEGYSITIDGTLYIDLERGLYLFSAKGEE